MKVRYWGVRGSIAVPGPRTVRAGGNTPCVSVEMSDGTLIVLDGGTGLRNLGRHLLEREAIAAGRSRGALFFTHYHWDHIQGLPFFEPAYIHGNVFDVYSPEIGSGGSPDDNNVVSLQHSAVNFPVPYETIKGAYRFSSVNEGVSVDLGTARIRPVRMNHADLTLGYTICERSTGAKLAYLCDTAPWEGMLLGAGMAEEGPAPEVGRRYRSRVVEAARRADLVIHDTFFDKQGYEARRDWGHSTPAHALDICRETEAKQLNLFHFNPDLDDAGVADLEKRTRAEAGGIEVTAAMEGLELALP